MPPQALLLLPALPLPLLPALPLPLLPVVPPVVVQMPVLAHSVSLVLLLLLQALLPPLEAPEGQLVLHLPYPQPSLEEALWGPATPEGGVTPAPG